MSQQSGIFISNSSSFSDVPVPKGKNIAYFLNINDGNSLYGMRSDRTVFPIITSTMRVHTTTLNQAAILNLETIPVKLLPAPVAGYENVILGITEHMIFNVAGFGPNAAVRYRAKVAVETANNLLLTGNTTLLSAASEVVKVVGPGAGATNASAHNAGITSELECYLPVGTGIGGGGPLSKLIISVRYASVLIDPVA